MTISLPPLPFKADALAPVISERTMDYHYGKHHRGYVDKLTDQIRDTELARRPLAEVARVAWESGNLPVFNNAAQAWNHEFFWSSLSPEPGVPDGTLAPLITRDFGTVQQLTDQLVTAAMSQFGSGWVWLVWEADRLKVVTTANADSPLLYERQLPLLTIDVWEHAYYLDYQNDRKRYAEALVSQLLNWNAANDRLNARSAGTADAPRAASAGG